MSSAKLLNLIAVSTLAILACSFGASPVTALSVDTTHLAARGHGHAALAKKRRGNNAKRCKPRPASSSAGKPATTPNSPSNTTQPAPATTAKPAPATTTKASTGGSSSGSGTNNQGGNTSSNGGVGKVGLAWVGNNGAALSHFKSDKTGPIYSWSPWKPEGADEAGFKFLPMLWGNKQISDFKKLVVEKYADTVLGFNEPNQDGQSNMSPEAAASLWKQYIDPLKNKGYNLISPACTNAPSGKDWMKKFIDACNDCQLDGIAIHFYGTDPQQMISYMQDMHSTFQKPIWPTEFACQNFGGGAQCSTAQVFDFMKTVKSFMDNTDWVAHYFAFGALSDMGNVNPANQLLGGNGYPTQLGQLYIS